MKNVLLFILTCGLWGLVLINRKYGFKGVVIALAIFFGIAAFGHITTPQQSTGFTAPPTIETNKVNMKTSEVFWRNGLLDIVDYNAKDIYYNSFVERLTLVPSNGNITPVSIQKSSNCTKGESVELSFRMGGKGDFVKGFRTCIEDGVVAYEPITQEGINLVLNKVKNNEQVCTEAKEFGDYDCTYPVNNASKVMFEELYLPKLKKIAQQKQNAL